MAFPPKTPPPSVCPLLDSRKSTAPWSVGFALAAFLARPSWWGARASPFGSVVWVESAGPVRRYLPAFAGGPKNNVTIRQLLTHRSGLPAGRDIWRIADSPWEAREAVIGSALMDGCPPGACYEYSDLGPDILGFVAEAVSGERLDKFLEKRVWSRLGMTDTYYRPPGALPSRGAPTA